MSSFPRIYVYDQRNFERDAGQAVVYESKRSARHSPAVVVAVLAAAAPGCCCCCGWNIAVGWRNKDPYIMFSSDCCCWPACWLPAPTTGELPIPAAPLLPPGTIGAPGVGGTRLPSSTATRTDSMCRRENTCSWSGDLAEYRTEQSLHSSGPVGPRCGWTAEPSAGKPAASLAFFSLARAFWNQTCNSARLDRGTRGRETSEAIRATVTQLVNLSLSVGCDCMTHADSSYRSFVSTCKFARYTKYFQIHETSDL